MDERHPVLIERGDGVATIRLNRPHRRNALDLRAKRELGDAIAGLASDAETRVIVLTGVGSAFCSGADLADLSPATGLAYREELRALQRSIIQGLTEAPKPVIGAINGVTAGGGLGLALACDVLLAARSAAFLPSFVSKVGVAADLGTAWLLPRAIGSRRAAAMLLLDEKVDAETACRWGLVHRVVDDDELEQAAQTAAARVADSAPLAVAATKRLLRLASTAGDDEFFDSEADTQALLRATADHAEAITAFTERRRPHFLGR